MGVTSLFGPILGRPFRGCIGGFFLLPRGSALNDSLDSSLDHIWRDIELSVDIVVFWEDSLFGAFFGAFLDPLGVFRITSCVQNLCFRYFNDVGAVVWAILAHSGQL